MPPTATKYYHSHTEWLFHCHIKVKLPIHCGVNVLEHCFDLLEEVDHRYNSYREGSFFDLINRRAGAFVEVDPVTIQLLSCVKEVSRIVKGNYDVSIMPLLRLWGFYNPESVIAVPAAEELHATLERVDYKNIEIEGNAVRIGIGQELITGSFLKAYAVDCVLDYLRSEGVDDALINAGGSTICGVNATDNPEWKVRVSRPLQAEESGEEVSLANACLSLSGQDNNYLLIGDRRYSHILNARTGMPSANLQVMLITRSAFWGDVLATALMASPVEELSDFSKELKRLHPFSGYLTDASLQRITL